MESYRRITLIILLAGISSFAFAQKAVSPGHEGMTAGSEAEAKQPAMPYLAEINSDDVYVRSGPGTNYYYCGKLSKGDKVKVVGSKFSWSQISPPGGSYSWISQQYVQVDAQNAADGTVIGDAVRVYAGSDDVEPMHSTTMQVKLSKGDKVVLLGEEKDGYYKISPPAGAYVWVSTQYVQPIGSLIRQEAQAKPEAVVAPKSTMPKQAETSGTSVEAVPAPVEDLQMTGVRAIEELIKAERAKPLEKQDFSQMKKALGEVAANKQSSKAAIYAEKLLKSIERYELVQQISKAAKMQDEQFEKTTKNIEEAKEAKLAQIEDTSKFSVVGQLAESSIFAETPGARYFRIKDSEDNTICYAVPTGKLAEADLSGFIGKKVGLVGSIEPNHEISGALIRFTDISELK